MSLLTIYSVVDSVAMCAFLNKVNSLATSRFTRKQADYSLSISMRNSLLGLLPLQLSRDKNLELIILL